MPARKRSPPARRRGPPRLSEDPQEGSVVLWIRMPRGLLERLDAHVRSERERTGYATLARSDVARALLDRALSGLER